MNKNRVNEIIAAINTASAGLSAEDAKGVEILKRLTIELLAELDK